MVSTVLDGSRQTGAGTSSRPAPVRAVKRGGRRSKAAGYRAEKKIEAILARYGFKRMAMSGALGGEHAGDLRRRAEPGMVCEVKRRKGGLKQLRAWIAQGGADFAVLEPGNGDEPLVCLTLTGFCALLARAGMEVTT